MDLDEITRTDYRTLIAEWTAGHLDYERMVAELRRRGTDLDLTGSVPPARCPTCGRLA